MEKESCTCPLNQLCILWRLWTKTIVSLLYENKCCVLACGLIVLHIGICVAIKLQELLINIVSSVEICSVLCGGLLSGSSLDIIKQKFGISALPIVGNFFNL